ncbi:MAG: HRDC domain-containing protein [Planctomycetes bacterium]|nr:HRDC domain-containing protein [Planctomycetota bacterium]
MPDKTEIITDASGLERVIDELLQAPRISLDIESDGFYNYRDRVCIVTLSSEERDYVVDTLALNGEAILMQKLLDRPDVPVLMHSGQNDVLALKRDYEMNFALVHDTAVAAMLLGLQQTGLAALSHVYLGMKLEKELQRHDWSRRPIELEHMQYLINDTRHLFRLHDLIEDELKKHELLDEYRLECDAVAQSEPRKREFDPERFRRIKGHGDLSDQQRGALQAIYAWRDELASQLDRAPFRVMGDATLLEIARKLPKDLNALESVRGVGEWVIKDHGRAMLAAVENGLASPTGVRPPRRKPTEPVQRLDPQQRERLGRLKRWREKEAERRGVGLQAILPTAVLKDLITEPPSTTAELAKVERVGMSRVERYGDEILKIVGKPPQ